MNFSTVTKSGVFQYIQKDSTKKISEPDLEFKLMEAFNSRYEKEGIRLFLYSSHLPLAFIIEAETHYSTDNPDKRQHPAYEKLILCTGYLHSLADSFDLKCTRKGT